MLETLSLYIPLIFGLTTSSALLFFLWIIKTAAISTIRDTYLKIGVGLLVWLIIQAILTFKGVYNTDVYSLPPKLVLFGIFPPIITIVYLFNTKRGRTFIDSLALKKLTYLHIVRVPVEMVLFWLFLNKAIPEVMTFGGINFDILAGVTAPIMAYFGLERRKIKRTATLVWNWVCLGLLINIVVIAFLSAPSPMQKIAFDQPNIAILSFPFSWLPTFIVPLVLFSHLASIRQLVNQKKKNLFL